MLASLAKLYKFFCYLDYIGKTIMKIRFDSKRRVYGYRKGDRFRILRIEIDYSIGDKG